MSATSLVNSSRVVSIISILQVPPQAACRHAARIIICETKQNKDPDI